MTTTREEAAARLDQAMKGRRRQMGTPRWRDLIAKANAAGYRISYETIRAIRRGDSSPSEHTKAAVEHMMGWAPGSVDDAMNGKAPALRQEARTLPSRREYDDPALQAIWDIAELTEAERRAAIMAVRVIRDQQQRADVDQRFAGNA